MITVRQIIEAVAASYGLTPEEIMAKGRREPVARARHVAMYLAREMTGKSYPALGVLFERDHTTVIHGCQHIAALFKDSKGLRKRVQALLKALHEAQP